MRWRSRTPPTRSRSTGSARTTSVVETKPDLTPVTETDRAVESALRERLAVERPGDGVVGEEHGVTGGGSRRWIVDPIDGTRNYSRGIPVWATLIALEEHGELLLGVVSAPALGRRWWAEPGAGAFVNGEPHPCLGGGPTSRTRCSASRSSSSSPDLASRCWHPRGYGDFWAHMLVAEGAADGAIDAVGVSLWDLAAIQPIVEEAGGQFSDRAGAPRADGGTAVSSNGLLHELLLEAAR